MKKILFLCVANSARSQMAEGLARHYLPQDIEVYSAGSEPSYLHPHAITVMSEIGIDISQQYAKSIDEIEDDRIDTIITLCAEEICPVFLSDGQRMHWPMSDPAAGSDLPDKMLESFREVRDQLLQRILYQF